MNIQPITLVQSLLGISGVSTSTSSVSSSFSSSRSSGADTTGAVLDKGTASVRENSPLLHESFEGFLNSHINSIRAGLKSDSTDGKNARSGLVEWAGSEMDPALNPLGIDRTSALVRGLTVQDASVDTSRDGEISKDLFVSNSSVREKRWDDCPILALLGLATPPAPVADAASLPENLAGRLDSKGQLGSMIERLRSALQKLVDYLDESKADTAVSAESLESLPNEKFLNSWLCLQKVIQVLARAQQQKQMKCC